MIDGFKKIELEEETQTAKPSSVNPKSRKVFKKAGIVIAVILVALLLFVLLIS